MHMFLFVFTLLFLALSNSTTAAFVNQCNQINDLGNILKPNLFYSNAEINDDLFMQFLDKQKEHIDALTQAINEQNDIFAQASLRLFNERGTAYFFIGQFENAINDFSYVINNVVTKLHEEEALLGSALWGRMLCYAFAGQLDNTNNDASLIVSLFTDCRCDENRAKKDLFVLSHCNARETVLPIAKFAYPEEEISKNECHDRVQRISSKMYSLADLIPDWLTRQAVFWVIETVSKKAHNCCDSTLHWTECLGPIVDVWKKLENTWDTLVDLFKKGIDLKTFLTAPLNL